MTTPDYSGLSEQLRLYFETLSPDLQENFLQVTQRTFGIKNRSNVVRWVTRAGVQRNFVNSKVSPFELEMRVSYAKGLTTGVPPVGVQKVAEFPSDPDRAAKKLIKYLTEEYTRESVTAIAFLPGRIEFTYDAYNNDFTDEDDDASEEWQDIPTEPETPPGGEGEQS